jgi:peptidoglycan/LPS O-acetylase OafA/YrhL
MAPAAPATAASPGAPAARFYLPQLDGLRFLAFVLVFLHHLKLPPAGSMADGWATPWLTLRAFGWLGVELFFVLSAFLMTSLLLREQRARGTIAVGRFFIRRILRIWPLYFFTLALGFAALPLVAYSTFGTSAHHALVATYLLPYALFLGNFAVAIAGYPGGFAMPSLALLWTISFEEQFYVTLPFLLLLLATARASTWLKLLGAVALFGLAVRVALLLLPVPPHPATWVIPIARPDSFVVGMLLALAIDRQLPVLRPWAGRGPLAVALAVALLVGVALFPDIDSGSWHRLWQYPAVAVGFGALLLALCAGRGLAPRVFASRPLVALGRISYGLYVYQLLALELASHLFARFVPDAGRVPLAAWAAECLVGLTLTIAFAAASYRWLERPFLRRKAAYELVHSRPP